MNDSSVAAPVAASVASPAAKPIADVHARAGAEAEHRDANRRMFERIAPTYDALNRVMSAGIDRSWRRRAIAEIAGAPAGPVLDLCAGTLDLTVLLDRARPRDRVIAVDFSESMLAAGQGKVPRAETVVADATALPFGDGEIAAVVCGFGMRNLGSTEAGAREVRRVLKPGGLFVTLELFRPTRLVTRAFHKAYAQVVLPTVGGWMSGDRGAYEYLAGSMGTFLTRDEYEGLMRRVGFDSVRGTDLTLGIASIVRARVAS
jgi:ubiquinone/menaquinone biosynthesis methyltransferase